MLDGGSISTTEGRAMGWIFDGVYLDENELIEGDEIIEVDESDDDDFDELFDDDI